MKNIENNHPKTTITILVTVLLILASNIGYSQEARPHKKMSPEERHKVREERFEHMVSDIPNLTVEQKEKLYSIHAEYMERTKAAVPQKPHLSKEEREKLSKEEREAMIDDRAKRRAAIEKLKLAEREEMNRVLTDQQIEYIKERRSKMREQRREKIKPVE